MALTDSWSKIIKFGNFLLLSTINQQMSLIFPCCFHSNILKMV